MIHCVVENLPRVLAQQRPKPKAGRRESAQKANAHVLFFFGRCWAWLCHAIGVLGRALVPILSGCSLLGKRISVEAQSEMERKITKEKIREREREREREN